MSERSLIVGGHIRPKADIVTHVDEYGRTVLDSETHFAPHPVHLAVDHETGLVYAGATEAEALGIVPDDEDEAPARHHSASV
jgi:hypothetical protein